MVSVMMTIIIYGLYSMFNQTQKSFRANNAQVDVMTAGRMALDAISRDIELLAACNTENGANFLTLLSYPYDYPNTRYNRSLPMIQATVPGDTNGPYRTNFMQDMFFLQKQSNCWVPCAYFVGDTTIVTNSRATNAVYQVNSNGIGGLYRMGFSKLNELGEAEPSTEYSTNTAYGWIQQFRGINDGSARGYYHTNANLLAEGVVHFAIKCYDAEGQYIEYTNYYRPNVSDWDRIYRDSAGIRRTNGTPQKSFNIYTKIPNPDLKMDDLVEDYLDYAGTWRINSKLLFPTNDVDMATNLVILGQMIGTGTRSVVTDNLFMSNAIPSYIEIELGLLEPQAIERVKAIGNPDARRQYLLRNSGQVHLFRKRIPVRMVMQ